MPPSKIHEKFPAWLVLMAALTALGPLAIDMYLPAFPNMAASLNTSQGQVERTLASYLIGLAAAQIVYGPLADRYGRKLTILAGLFVFTLASIGSIFTTNIEHLVIWRVLQALGGAAGMVVPRAVIRDRLETREAAKALSLLMLITGLMPILAPIAGGQLLLLGSWRFIFAFMAIFGVLLLAWVYYGMSETLAPENVRPLKISGITKNYLELLRHRQFMCHTLAGGFGMAGLFAYLTGSPHVFINLYDIKPQSFGFYFGINAASYILAAQLNAYLLDRLSPARLLLLAQIAVVISTVVGLVFTGLGVLPFALLMAFLMLYLACMGFINPNSVALALAYQGKRLGVASALMGALQMSCGALAGISISLWETTSALPLNTALLLCALLSATFGYLGSRQ